MSNDSSRMTDAFSLAMKKADSFEGQTGIVGYGVVELRGPDGKLKHAEPFANMITNYGDQYYAQMAIKGVSPANPTAPTTLVARMKLGTGGETSVNKSAATGENIQTYVTSVTATKAFDATYPQAADVDGSNNTGWNATYKTTWAAGEATQNGWDEATISTDTTDTADVAGECIARVTFTAVDKGANDTLAITWSHKFLGS